LARDTGNGQVKVTQLSRGNINEKLDGKDAGATVQVVTFEPGQKDSPHRHVGPVFGYVLEGEYQHAINDEPVNVNPDRKVQRVPTEKCSGPEPLARLKAALGFERGRQECITTCRSTPRSGAVSSLTS